MISDFKDAFDSLAEADLPTVESGEITDAMEQIKLLANRDRFTWERLLPPDLAEAVALITDVDPSDPLTATMILLCSLSGVLKLGTRIQHGDDYSVPANLYLGAIGPSGLSKSNLLKKLVRHPRADINNHLKDVHDNRLSNWAEACAETERGQDKPPKPLRILSLVNDYTSEALDRQLEAHEPLQAPLQIFKDELSGLLLAIEADTKRGRGNAEAQFLELFDGEGSTQIRIGSELRSYETCHVSILGGIQPDELKKLIGGKDATGKFARFLMLRIPLVPLKLVDDSPAPEVKAAKAGAKEKLRKTFNALYGKDPATYTLSDEARRLYNRWFSKKQAEALRIKHPVISSMLAKNGGQSLRVCGLLHLVHTMGEVTTIPAETMQLAIEIVDQLTHETRSFHAPVAGGAQDTLRTIHEQSWNHGQPKPVSTQCIKDKNSGLRDLKAGDFQQMVDALVASNLGSKVPGARKSVKYLASKPMPS